MKILESQGINAKAISAKKAEVPSKSSISQGAVFQNMVVTAAQNSLPMGMTVMQG